MNELLGIESYLDTIEGMTVIRNNSGNDENTDTLKGAEWYSFDGVVCNNIYVNGNNWIGFGKSSAQLNICYRDGKTYYVYRQEGVLEKNIKFIKVRVEGHSVYNSTAAASALKYEIFIFETGDMFINIIQHPNNSSYLGTTSIVFGGKTNTIPMTTATEVPYYISVYNKETGYEIAYELITFYSKLFLLADADNVYKVEENKLIVIDGLELANITAQDFNNYGSYELLKEELIKSLINPKILTWTDAQEPLKMSANVVAMPHTQTIIADVDMTSEAIINIRNIEVSYTGLPLLAFSINGGVTWLGYIADEWIESDMNMQGTANLDYENMGQLLGDVKKFKIKITLIEGSSIEIFKINFNNVSNLEVNE